MSARPETRNSFDTPHLVRNDGDDHRYQWCRCAECGHTGLCMPTGDFYTRPGKTELVCELCITFRKPTAESAP